MFAQDTIQQIATHDSKINSHTVFPLIEAGSQIQAGGQTSFVLIEAGSLTEAGGSKRRMS